MEKVHLTTRDDVVVSGKTVADEARKGYDLLVMGLARPLTPKGGFTKRFNDIAAGFDGPLCIVLKGPRSRISELGPGSVILVAVNGTETARRGAELALAIARTNRSLVRVLYVSRHGDKLRAETISHRREEAVLKDIARLAERYGVEIATSVQAKGHPADAIVRQADRNVSLLVMGVSRRSGDELLFGETATGVMQKCTRPMVLLSDEQIRRTDTEQEARRSSSPDEEKTRPAQ